MVKGRLGVENHAHMTPDELWDELVVRVRRYHPSDDISLIEKAYLTARNAQHSITALTILFEPVADPFHDLIFHLFCIKIFHSYIF